MRGAKLDNFSHEVGPATDANANQLQAITPDLDDMGNCMHCNSLRQDCFLACQCIHCWKPVFILLMKRAHIDSLFVRVIGLAIGGG